MAGQPIDEYELHVDDGLAIESTTTNDEPPVDDHSIVRQRMDDGFYKLQVGEAIDGDLAEHYLTVGWINGFDPHPDFSTSFYIANNRDVDAAGINPFLHYIKWGEIEGRPPRSGATYIVPFDEIECYELINKHIDASFYLKSQVKFDVSEIDATAHYMARGCRMGLDPSSDFSTQHYLSLNHDVEKSGANPFYHYLRWGRHEGRSPNPNSNPDVDKYRNVREILCPHFDYEYYISQIPSLKDTDVDPILHYHMFGWRSGLDPSEDFSTLFYLNFHPEIHFGSISPLQHYIENGYNEGSIPFEVNSLLTDTTSSRKLAIRRLIKNDFDAEFYRDNYADMRGLLNDPIEHYILFGGLEGRDPRPDIDGVFYLNRYPSVRRYNIDPLTHYILWGKEHNFARHANDKVQPKISSTLDHAKLRDTMITNASENLHSTSVPSREFSSSSLTIDWIVPDYGIGSGGHMTIFRMIHWLEYFGHRCRIWVMSSGKLDLEHKYQEILKYYQFVKAEVFQYGDETSLAVGDVIVATSWDSAHIVSQLSGFKERFYFVQDYEPLFYGRGSRSVIAESTYQLDLSCICASPWLAEVMTERHGRWAEFFYLSHDRNCYFPSVDPVDNPVPRIAVYGRIGSERRCVELSILGLAELAKRGVKFHADIFGTDENLGALPFPYTNHGILPPSDLGALYRECDVGICFSSTNYSLVPQEMMGCGLPVIELDVESTRAIFNESIVAFAPPQTRGIADCVMALLSDPARLKRLGESGREWADTHSWEDSARRVEASMISRLQSNSKFLENTKPVADIPDNHLKASVIIPTYNGGKLLKSVVEKVLEQKCPWSFELIIVDSSSSDSSTDGLPQDDRLKIHRIAKSEFQHGRTRNLGASLGKGEYLLFLTQDALPVDEFWLYNFVSTMEHFPDAAGGFGAHLAYPHASIYNRDALKQHFRGFNDFPLCISKSYRTELWNAQDRGYVQLLHFFSDNNSCLKRSVWEKIPYAEVEYGEDQLWALEIIKQGMSKVYAPNAVVYHSHDYDYKQSFERAEIEATFFFEHFGYDFSHDDPEGEIRSRRAHAAKFAARFDIPDEVLEERVQQIYGEVLGHQAGAVKAKMLRAS